MVADGRHIFRFLGCGSLWVIPIQGEWNTVAVRNIESAPLTHRSWWSGSGQGCLSRVRYALLPSDSSAFNLGWIGTISPIVSDNSAMTTAVRGGHSVVGESLEVCETQRKNGMVCFTYEKSNLST